MPLSKETKATSRAVRAALKALFLESEQMAVNGYTTFVGDGTWVFNDAVWKHEDPDGFKIAKRARTLLGLKPYEFHGRGRCHGRP